MSAIEELHPVWARAPPAPLVDLLDLHQIEIGVTCHAEPRERFDLARFGLWIGLAGRDHAGNLTRLVREQPRDSRAAGMSRRVHAMLVDRAATEKGRPHRAERAGRRRAR